MGCLNHKKKTIPSVAIPPQQRWDRQDWISLVSRTTNSGLLGVSKLGDNNGQQELLFKLKSP